MEFETRRIVVQFSVAFKTINFSTSFRFHPSTAAKRAPPYTPSFSLKIEKNSFGFEKEGRRCPCAMHTPEFRVLVQKGARFLLGDERSVDWRTREDKRRFP